MQAYKNDPQLKKLVLEEVINHRKQDKIIQGSYGMGRGMGRGMGKIPERNHGKCEQTLRDFRKYQINETNTNPTIRFTESHDRGLR